MESKKDIKKDCIGRPIPYWNDITLLVPTNSDGINLNAEKLLMSQKFCTAFTDISQANKNVSLISCKLKEGSRILNLNDIEDYKLAKSCMGEFNVESVDDDLLNYLSYCGFAGVFYPTVVGVRICNPARHLISKGITRKH
jgi:hypothetical protein